MYKKIEIEKFFSPEFSKYRQYYGFENVIFNDEFFVDV